MSSVIPDCNRRNREPEVRGKHMEEPSRMKQIAVSWMKVWTPSAAFLAVINLASMKDIVIMIGAIVTMVCTILVTRSTIRKNNR